MELGNGILLANPSRTEWPNWLARPPMCYYCGLRVTLKQYHRTFWDERIQEGRVWHTGCEPIKVALHVTRSTTTNEGK